MAASKGRDFIVKRDATGSGGWQLVGGMRSNQITINGETIDVTTKDGTEWRLLLSGGVRSASISGSGIYDDGVQVKAVRDAAMDGSIETLRLYDASGAYFQGTFRVTNYQQTGDYKGAVEFSCTFESASEITVGP